MLKKPADWYALRASVRRKPQKPADCSALRAPAILTRIRTFRLLRRPVLILVSVARAPRLPCASARRRKALRLALYSNMIPQKFANDQIVMKST